MSNHHSERSGPSGAKHKSSKPYRTSSGNSPSKAWTKKGDKFKGSKKSFTKKNGPKGPEKKKYDQPKTARELALACMISIRQDRKTLDDAMALHPHILELDARDRGFLRLMLLSTLRHYGQLNAILDRMIAVRPKAGMDWVNDLLTLSLAQLLFLDTPIHAVASQALTILDQKRASRFKSLVNGVLRGLDREPDQIADILENPGLNIPNWMMKGWKRAINPDPAALLPALLLDNVPTDITLHGAHLGQLDDLAARLDAHQNGLSSLRLPATPDITVLPGFNEGQWWVQDLAATACMSLLDHIDLKDKDVIDLCAAPGGKTAWLASRGADVTAVDFSYKRNQRLLENMQRLDLDVAVLNEDASLWTSAAQADLVVLDAPCSATGTLRRHPEIALIRDRQDVQNLATLQRKIIDNALTMVKPGGYFLFITCSLQPEEGEAHLDYMKFEREGDFTLVPPTEDIFETWPGMARRGGYLRTHAGLYDEHGGMDGFFAMLFQRTA